ncbi:MAG: PDDEXK nuclease domain-containing protein [Desulfovibrio sp.]|jgi:predicted nuclease of restriction endonuclease-like (RecB) superfamily|nr:PDDEXK nuclease domain-containing protein [Desulfovibrio sp.]
MKKQTPATDSRTTELIHKIREIILATRSLVVRSIDTAQISMCSAIGQRIVEDEQKGEKRATYGKQVLELLAQAMTAEFGRGFSRRNLELMRRFYILYSPRVSQSQIPQSLTAELTAAPSEGNKTQSLTAELPEFGAISWTHYVALMGVANPDERLFYEIEASRQGWDVRTLERQIDSCLYERLALSTDKDKVAALSRDGDMPKTPRQLVKDPLILEFLGIEEKADYSERDLESAVIDSLESFLLELGKGFLFEARQKRFTFGSKHFFVDLVFYNRLLRCYVLIDLKIGDLTHQDLGQMQMYVNYFDRHVKLSDENPSNVLWI